MHIETIARATSHKNIDWGALRLILLTNQGAFFQLFQSPKRFMLSLILVLRRHNIVGEDNSEMILLCNVWQQKGMSSKSLPVDCIPVS